MNPYPIHIHAVGTSEKQQPRFLGMAQNKEDKTLYKDRRGVIYKEINGGLVRLALESGEDGTKAYIPAKKTKAEKKAAKKARRSQHA